MGKNAIPNAYALLAAIFAIIVSGKLDLNQQNVVGNFLQTIGQSILTINAADQQQGNNNSQSKGEEMYYQLKLLKDQIQYMEDKLNEKDYED
ncbi:MAG: hypothetical protein N4A57_02225 [Anaeromicrobium sp.]|jgi:hypothetical protein|uniref:hypothetical protein n=1 Tax=Anaeromicrobium sp. TaxID=1929132 RepID=UPI0025F64A45|nr:hypothetical protein [Anaeromicrobium sp.]MCT4593084.1 hypothetical protein [Anaeromicrobium sp.]